MTTTVITCTTPGGAGDEVHRRATDLLESGRASSYREAVHVVCADDETLAEAYAGVPARVTTLQSAPTAGPSDSEIEALLVAALTDQFADKLSGALGELAKVADTFSRLGMTRVAAAKLAVAGNPSIVEAVRRMLSEVREPLAKTAGEVDARAKKLQAATPTLTYKEALAEVLNSDPTLKAKYAGGAA